MSDPVLLSHPNSHTALITINRPEVRNALNPAAMDALETVVKEVAALDDLRVLIVTGSGGKAFISGGDLNELHELSTEEDGFQQHDQMNGTLKQLSSLPVPVIAALEGAARGGGCEVMLACDLRIAANNATFGFAQVRMGVTPGWGGAERLFDLVGYSQALDLLLTGRVLDASEALSLGLINGTCAPGEALETTLALASRLAAYPPLAVRGVKQVLQGYRTLPRSEANQQERSTFARLWASADHAEASAAFLEKREPQFRGE